MAVYRSKHTQEQIPMVPVRGYVTKVNFSKESVEWLMYLENTMGIKICHALNERGERNIDGAYVDGFHQPLPFVNKYSPYPIGHPEIITSNFGDFSQYFGIVKCSILPPPRLYHPVLPYRSRGKLTFPLCSKCVETQNNICEHDDTDWASKGTWVTIEVQKASDVGYKLMKMYDLHHFKEQSTPLFKSYINTFLKTKQEASGWPERCETATERSLYIKIYEDHEGVVLDPDQIVKNSGRRQVSKLCLNSFWGRWGMKKIKIQPTLVSSLPEFNSILTNTTKEIVKTQSSQNLGFFHLMIQSFLFVIFSRSIVSPCLGPKARVGATPVLGPFNRLGQSKSSQAGFLGPCNARQSKSLPGQYLGTATCWPKRARVCQRAIFWPVQPARPKQESARPVPRPVQPARPKQESARPVPRPVLQLAGPKQGLPGPVPRPVQPLGQAESATPFPRPFETVSCSADERYFFPASSKGNTQFVCR
ncbi:hypothetical protein HNY73_010769 [Argiope bruennichi]|uniref:DNA-directed DNA polymerase n=1 Tax=Argiope bruennichi TaxID=94029 RepID=A0A8T0F4I9_ARGBR|nr:hypothetical protein HNY73_010769 [Argiope bruennichi]